MTLTNAESSSPRRQAKRGSATRQAAELPEGPERLTVEERPHDQRA